MRVWVLVRDLFDERDVLGVYSSEARGLAALRDFLGGADYVAYGHEHLYAPYERHELWPTSAVPLSVSEYALEVLELDAWADGGGRGRHARPRDHLVARILLEREIEDDPTSHPGRRVAYAVTEVADG